MRNSQKRTSALRSMLLLLTLLLTGTAQAAKEAYAYVNVSSTKIL